jgi:hypothetical protein
MAAMSPEVSRRQALSGYWRQVLAGGVRPDLTGSDPWKGIRVMIKSASTSLILLGILAVVAGIVAIA